MILAKTWKQPRYIMEYYSAMKNEIMPFVATWINLEIIIISEANQGQILYDITYMQNLRKNANEFIYQTEIDSQT